MAKILLVDDDPNFRESLLVRLRQMGFAVDPVEGGEEALARLDASSYALIISDVRMPGMSGVELLRRVKEEQPHIPVLMVTAYADVADARDALKLGAHDYIIKPFSGEELTARIREIGAEIVDSVQEILSTPDARPKEFERIVTCDPKMRRLLDNLDKVGRSDASVLLSGESGTGKEVFARAIHECSPRAKGPFVAVNCAALPADLLESELFGHEKGAFTGASAQRRGRFELADGGTMLLDEVSEMPLALQAKLLRAIQEREIDRVGGSGPIKVNVRIIATTNADLKEIVANGSFREDLFYRLCVVPITLPPLRDRRGDITLLARHFLRQFSEHSQKNVSDFNDAAVQWLENQPWPGNVRELSNIVERTVLFCQGPRIELSDLTMDPWGPREAAVDESRTLDDGTSRVDVRVGMTADEAERELILRTLEACEGNKSRAAEVLGLTARTIRNKLREYGLMGSNT